MPHTMTMRPALLRSTALAAYASAPPAAAPSMATTVEAVDMARQRLSDSGGLTSDVMLKRSADSAAMLDYWDQTDALVDGHAAVKKAGERFLPKFFGETGPEFSKRLEFTKYTNVYRDIIESLSSKPFEQEVKLDDSTPQEIVDFWEDVDGAGNNGTIFSAQTFFNSINSAIDWIFVDYDKPNPNVRTLADAKRVGVRPYWSHVLGRNVLDPRIQVINGKETLVYIKIFEPGTGSPDRVRIFERSDTGLVTWTLYEKSDTVSQDGKTQFVQIDAGTISIGVIPLVPFATGRRDGRTFRYFPAMRDAADLQVQLYQDESALKWAKTLTGYPMLTGNGVKPQIGPDKLPLPVAVGPNRVLYAQGNGEGRIANWQYIEPQATSLTFLANDVKETIAQLRELGRQPLTAQSGASVTVIAAGMAAGKARNTVVAWALGLKDALENALIITAQWMSMGGIEPIVQVFTEFDDGSDNLAELPALQALRISRDISRDTILKEYMRRGVLSDDFNADDDAAQLLLETPPDPETGPPVKDG